VSIVWPVCEGCRGETSRVYSLRSDSTRHCLSCLLRKRGIRPTLELPVDVGDQSSSVVRFSGDVRLSSSRVLVVGEVVPEGVSREDAMALGVPGGSGNRLLRVLGMTEGDFSEYLERVNLCLEKWGLEEAEASVDRLLGEYGSRYRYFLLLGIKVRRAFAGRTRFLPVGRYCHLGYLPEEKLTLLSIPHPSGRCRSWNDPSAITEVRKVLVAVAGRYVPWGGEWNVGT
jgi:hypothetical protein